jgi:small subunit ribosomal protein S2
MSSIDKMASDGTLGNLSKREKLQIARQRAKLEKNLGSISDLTRLPSALFIIDVGKEHIAVKEANRLGIPVFAMVDTNSDPSDIDFVIPANDDASKSISLIIDIMCTAVEEGLNERKNEKDKEPTEKDTVEEIVSDRRRPRRSAIIPPVVEIEEEEEVAVEAKAKTEDIEEIEEELDLEEELEDLLDDEK